MTAVLSLPPGDIYNLSVTACTERGSNTSMLRLVKLGKKRTQVCVCASNHAGGLVFVSLGLAWSSPLKEMEKTGSVSFINAKKDFTLSKKVHSTYVSVRTVSTLLGEGSSLFIIRLEEPQSLRILEMKGPSAIFSTLSDTISLLHK